MTRKNVEVFKELASSPATPASGLGLMYLKSDGAWYTKNDAGTEVAVGGAVVAPVVHRARGVRTGTALSITAGTATKVTFGTESYDPNGILTTSTFTAARAGYWIVNASIEWAAGNTGRREIFIRRGGTEVVSGNHTTSTSATVIAQSCTWEGAVSVNDNFELWCYQGHSTALTISGWMSVREV